MPESYIDVAAAIAQAEKLLKDKESLLERIDIVRTDLRHAAVMGGVSQEQKAWIADNFPTVKRTRLTPEQKAAELDRKAAALRKGSKKVA